MNKLIFILSAAVILSHSAHATSVPCGARYQPDVSSAPAGSQEISFSSISPGEIFTLDRSEMFTSAATPSSGFPKMNLHLKETIIPSQNGQPSQAVATWVCADLYSNTPVMHASLLYLGSVMPALDGSIYSGFRRYQMTWPGAQGMFNTQIVNDSTMNPYASAPQVLAQEWEQIHLYRTPTGDLCLTLAQPATNTNIWASSIRVFLKKVQ